MKMQSAVEEYLVEIEVRKYTPKTIRSYRCNLNLFLRFCAEKLHVETVEALTPAVVRQFSRCMSEAERKGTYINGVLKSIKSFIQYCYEEGYGGFDTRKTFKWCKEEKPVITAFSPEQVRSMLQSCRGHDYLSLRDYAILTLLFETGIRCWELCCIREEDIHDDFIIINGKNHMYQRADRSQKESSPYSAVITREQFLFYEMRTTAKLVAEGLNDEQVADRITSDNLFQYPTEKSVRRMALTCLRRLKALDDPKLVAAIASQPSDVSKQICLYAMMKQYRLVWDFMITVVGAKYENRDMSFSRMDFNVFMMCLQEQDDWVASWSDSTVTKVKQVLARILVDNEYLDSTTADHLNPVLIYPILEDAIRSSGDTKALTAFNCLA